MARTTHRDSYSTQPRPLPQSLWLLSTVAIAAIILSVMGESLTVADGSARQSAFTGEELIALTEPAAPVLSAPTTMRTEEPAEQATASPSAEAQPTDIEARGQAALDTISYPWRSLLSGWSIVFLDAKDGLYGLTMVPEKRIEIYVRDNQPTAFLAHVIAHELGHAVDVTLNDGPDRRAWEEARGFDSEPWWPGSGATDFSTGAGDFAESFAAWQVSSQSFRSHLADAPTADQIRLLAELSAG